MERIVNATPRPPYPREKIYIKNINSRNLEVEQMCEWMLLLLLLLLLLLFRVSQQCWWSIKACETWHFVVRWVIYVVLKDIGAFETSGTTHAKTQRHIPEDCSHIAAFMDTFTPNWRQNTRSCRASVFLGNGSVAVILYFKPWINSHLYFSYFLNDFDAIRCRRFSHTNVGQIRMLWRTVRWKLWATQGRTRRLARIFYNSVPVV